MQESENQLFKKIRKELQLDQKEFGSALNLTQASVSDIERGRNNVSPKVKRSLASIFFINLDFFKSGFETEIFLAGKEATAKKAAEQYRKEKAKGGLRDELDDSGLLLLRVEQLTKELNHKDEIINAKDELIYVLKSELGSWKKEFRNLSDDIAELKEFQKNMNLKRSPNEKKLNRGLG